MFIVVGNSGFHKTKMAKFSLWISRCVVCVCSISLQLVFVPHTCGSICSCVYVLYTSSKCVRVKDVDTDCVSPTLFKVTLTVWITVLPSFLTAHTRKDKYAHTHVHDHSRIAFTWRSPPTPRLGGQLIINLPAKWHYISSGPRHWLRGSPKKWQCYCLQPNKVTAVAH